MVLRTTYTHTIYTRNRVRQSLFGWVWIEGSKYGNSQRSSFNREIYRQREREKNDTYHLTDLVRPYIVCNYYFLILLPHISYLHMVCLVPVLGTSCKMFLVKLPCSSHVYFNLVIHLVCSCTARQACPKIHFCLIYTLTSSRIPHNLVM